MIHPVAVVGPGSVGGFIAAQLTAAGIDVLSCARRSFDEYVVESPIAPVRVPAKVLTTPAAVVGPVPWVLLTVKGHQTAGAAEWLAHLCGPDTVLVVVQNGVEGASRVVPFAHGAEVLPAVVYCAASLVGPGHVRHERSRLLIVPDVPAGHRLAELAAGSEVHVRATPEHHTEAWRKLGFNVATNGITALTGKTMEVLGTPAVQPLVRALLEETWAVAAADGAALGPADVDAAVRLLADLPPGGLTSTLQDRRAGRPTEHDELYGAVCRAGARHGIPTPHCATLAALLAGGDPEEDPVGAG